MAGQMQPWRGLQVCTWPRRQENTNQLGEMEIQVQKPLLEPMQVVPHDMRISPHRRNRLQKQKLPSQPEHRPRKQEDHLGKQTVLPEGELPAPTQRLPHAQLDDEDPPQE